MVTANTTLIEYYRVQKVFTTNLLSVDYATYLNPAFVQQISGLKSLRTKYSCSEFDSILSLFTEKGIFSKFLSLGFDGTQISLTTTSVRTGGLASIRLIPSDIPKTLITLGITNSNATVGDLLNAIKFDITTTNKVFPKKDTYLHLIDELILLF